MQINILIIDDDESKLAMMADSVSIYDGCVVTHAKTYEDAVDHLVNHYDLVVVDYFLHAGDYKNNGTGYDIFKSYKKLHPKAVVILYSGNCTLIEDESIRTQAIDAMQVQSEIFKFIENYKVDTEKKSVIPKKEAIMQKTKLFSYVPIILLASGIIGSFSVAQFKIDVTRADVITHCSEDKIYREKQAAKEIQTVATLTELMTMQREILKSIDELKTEVKRHN